ncbi:MAG: dUTP diphosphatase [Treponema sp.]|nr:dUTP diphosphatase [Treponema sp.]MBQ7166783.1 dUTP diphosphatase [Treponema sp.]
MHNNVKIKVLAKEGAALPVYKTEGAAGADVCAFLENDIVITPNERRLVPTGLFFEIPEGFEVQVRPRSGLALKNGITVFNTPGTIDSDYRGEIQVLLVNFSDKPYTVRSGERIAQLVVAPVTLASWEKSDTLSESERGEGGWGSTGGFSGSVSS